MYFEIYYTIFHLKYSLNLSNLKYGLPNLRCGIYVSKELGEKIVGKYPSSNYGRLSIISNYQLTIQKILSFC